MRLEHEFSIPAPPHQAWAVLMDVERVGQCLPGATVTSVAGDEFTGSMALKVGPVNANYEGTGRFETKDAEARIATIVATGNERRGGGSAKATISARLVADGDRTQVAVCTDLAVTGRLAQFGRGPMHQISEKIMAQFAECLEREMGEEQPQNTHQQNNSSLPAEDQLSRKTQEGNGSAQSDERSRPGTDPLNVLEFAFDRKQRTIALVGIGVIVVLFAWLAFRGFRS